MKLPGLDRENGVPYYRQLAAILREQIASGMLVPGEKLPSENEMSGIYKVNRHTVRQAMALMNADGLVYKKKGLGTYITPGAGNIIDYKVSRWTRFTENIMKVGHKPTARVLQHAELNAPAGIAGHLRVDPGEKVVLLEFLRFVDDKPFCVTTSYLPSKLVPGILNRITEHSSFYELLDRVYQLKPIRARSVFFAGFPNQEDALALEILLNHPVLKVESTIVLDSGVPLEYSIGRFRADRAKISVEF